VLPAPLRSDKKSFSAWVVPGIFCRVRVGGITPFGTGIGRALFLMGSYRVVWGDMGVVVRFPTSTAASPPPLTALPFVKSVISPFLTSAYRGTWNVKRGVGVSRF